MNAERDANAVPGQGVRRDVGGGRDLDHFERRLRAEGFRLIAGVDEAGRGALAGPLYAAAVILPEDFDVRGLNDSKLLTAQQREEWYQRITAVAVAVAVCRCFPRGIDQKGLHRSNLRLLRTTLYSLDPRPDFVLADGFGMRGMRLPHLSMKKGDMVTASVAAASVVAKVTRDRAMDRYHRRFPRYGWDHNRGYGTPDHRDAIAKYGPSPIHRMSFKGLKLFKEDPDLYRELYRRSNGEAGGEEEP